MKQNRNDNKNIKSQQIKRTKRMKLTAAVVLLGALACGTQALRPAPGVSDFISESGLPHCNEKQTNAGSFSVSRVRCGCDDDEEKVGKRLGYKYISHWKVPVFSAYCVPAGTADEPRVCRMMMPADCPKPGLLPTNCGPCGCDCTFVNREFQLRRPKKHRKHKKKKGYSRPVVPNYRRLAAGFAFRLTCQDECGRSNQWCLRHVSGISTKPNDDYVRQGISQCSSRKRECLNRC